VEVCIVNPHYYPFQGGIEKQIYELVKVLSKRGFNVKILTILQKGSEKEIKNFPYAECIFVTGKKIFLPKFYPYVPIFSPIELMQKFKKDCKNIKIIHFFSDLLGTQLINFKGSHVFLHTQQNPITDDKLPTYINLYLKLRAKTELRKYYLNCDKTTVISNFLKNELLKHFEMDEKKISVIPNGIDPKFFKFSEKKRNKFRDENEINNFFIFSAGRLVREKGFQNLIRAISLLKEYNISLGIAGTGYFKEYLIKLAKKLEVDLRPHGFLVGNDLVDAYCGSDLFVTPSIFHEPFGIVNIEAMSCERPVLASNVGGIPDIIKDNENGLLFNSLDVKDLSEKIRILIEDKKFRKGLGKSGRKTVLQKYDWDKLIDSWISLYKSL